MSAQADPYAYDGTGLTVVGYRIERHSTWTLPVRHERATELAKHVALSWPLPDKNVKASLNGPSADREVQLLGR